MMEIFGIAGAISAVFPDKNVGENKAIAISNYNWVGADASNYTLVDSPCYSLIFCLGHWRLMA